MSSEDVRVFMIGTAMGLIVICLVSIAVWHVLAVTEVMGGIAIVIAALTALLSRRRS